MFVSLINETLRPDILKSTERCYFFLKRKSRCQREFPTVYIGNKMHRIGSRNLNGSSNLES